MKLPANISAGISGKKKAASKEELAKEPQVDGFELNGRMTSSLDSLSSVLSSVSFIEVVSYRDGVAAINIETKDIKQQPYLFSMVYFNSGQIRVVYSIIPGMSPKRRRLEILSYFLNLMSLVSGSYQVQMKEVYQFLQEAIKDMSEYVSQDYEKMFAQHDMLKDELAHLKKEQLKLRASNDVLSRDNYTLKRKIEDLASTLNTLKIMSDDTLAVKIQDWISDHNGEINITEFAKVYGVPETRIEEMLNRLITEGYLELK